ncbi:hypothetical protein ACFQ0B_70765 [Nonomuraea thailandensis]
MAGLHGRAVRHAAHRRGGRRAAGPQQRAPKAAPVDPSLRVERELLKLAVQRPALLGPRFDALDPQAFTAPDHVLLHKVIVAAGAWPRRGPAGGSGWTAWCSTPTRRAPGRW